MSKISNSIRWTRKYLDFEDLSVPSLPKERPEEAGDPKRSRNEGLNSYLYRRHLFETFHSLRMIEKFPDYIEIRSEPIMLERREAKKRTLILDLDETLIHSRESSKGNPDIIVNVRGIWTGVNVRPYAKEMLAEAKKNFEIILFTASEQPYADAILRHLDPSSELFDHRLYRDSCTLVNGMYIKDIGAIKGRSLKDIVIVDNAVHSFAYHLDNGVPIVSWFDDQQDKELLNLIDYLEVLAHASDSRLVNRQNFNLEGFCEDYLREFRGNRSNF